MLDHAPQLPQRRGQMQRQDRAHAGDDQHDRLVMRQDVRGWLHDIEQEQIVTAPQSPRKPAPAVVYNFQVHAPADEEALHQLAELDVVIDEQDRDPRLGLGRASP